MKKGYINVWHKVTPSSKKMLMPNENFLSHVNYLVGHLFILYWVLQVS